MPVDRFLRRSFWVLPSAMVAIGALFGATAISALAGVAIEVDDARQLADAPPPWHRLLAPATPARAPSAAPILARNPFDHVTGPLVAPAAAAGSNAAPTRALDTSDPLSAPTCDGVDVDAIVASDDADWSLAALEGADKKALLLRRGGELAGKKLEFVGWDRVWFSSDGALCQAKLFGPRKAAAKPAPIAPVVSSTPRGRGAAPLDPELRKGIVAVSPTEYNIDRSVVDRILENQSELMRQARIIPVQENGRVVGVRLLGVRPDTLLGVLGMQNNDRLQTINGFEVANPEKALEAYARLRTADKLTIQVNRGGKNMNLDYNIR